MYKEDELVRVKSIYTKLIDIQTIIQRHNGIVQALGDVEGQPAILMLLIATAEQFNKLYNKNAEVIQEFDLDDIKGFISVRNFIAHDYDGINLALIENDLRFNIPKIITIVEKILAQ
ncbi:MAG: DUF86 domain-containing protein [Campylobacterales bacterium]|nr:DUF86 domain-containing protein [Campylobacterales bacterium]